MKRKINLIIAILAIFSMTGLISCAGKGDLNLTTNKGSELEGSYSKQGVDISFQVKQTDSNQVDLKLSIDSAVLTAKADYNKFTSETDGGGAVLTNVQRDVLNELSLTLEYELEKAENPTLAELLLIQMTGYWSKAPENFVYGKNTSDGSARKMGNEGVTCIKKGTFVFAEYNDSRGTHKESVKVGSTARAGYECMGRCGPGCGRSWIPSSWCKDCMDHDQCSHKNYSSGGSSDKNCGDEFNYAQDDWTFGVIRGCNGR